MTPIPPNRRIVRPLALGTLAMGALLATASFAADTTTPSQATTEAAKKPVPATEKAVALEKVEVISDRLAGTGEVVLPREEIVRQSGADGDLNRLFLTQAHVQFSDNEGRVNVASILDLRPSLISIAGGRPYDNSFQIDGLATNSLQDSSNQNIHAGDDVVGHPQTAVLNPALVESITLHTSDVPAEFGGFTGGVVNAKLRDPAGKLGGGFSYGRASSDWVRYHIAPAQISTANPDEPRFLRESITAFVDVPIGERTAALISWSRNTATLENTNRFASYGLIVAESETVSDNVMAKLSHRLSDQTTLRFTSFWSPYATENREQDLKTSHNDSWSNQVELLRRTDRSTLEASVGAVLADNRREAPQDIFTYKNFGANDLVNWVADTQTVGIRGGIGSLDSDQMDVPVALKYTLKATETGELAVGADYTYIESGRSRPKDSSAYRHQTTVGVNPNPLVASGDGASDMTVLAGEQGLNYRIVSSAFKINVELQTADLWAQWSDQGKILGLPWRYRVGARYDYNDFLGNSDIAPRATASINPTRWLTLRGGLNRYYSRPSLSYKIREVTPASIIYTRTPRNENGKLVFYAADWRLNSVSNPVRYSNAQLDTPYSDELSFGSSFAFGRFGALDLSYVERKNRDEFARSAAIVTPVNGVNVTNYRMTNDGFTDYRGGSVEWRTSWRNHQFRAGATVSETKTSTEELFDDYLEETMAQIVHYQGRLIARSELALVRANFSRPSYVTFNWSSDWFSKRLLVDVFGRWNTAYDRTDQSSTITLNGTRYDNYADVRIPAALITSLNVSWLAWKSERRGSMLLETRISNVFDKLPYAEGVTPANPYQEGRAIWAGVKYTF